MRWIVYFVSSLMATGGNRIYGGWASFVDDLEVTTSWWHVLSTKRSGGVFNLHRALWIWIEAKICSCSVSSSLSAVLSITALVFIDLWHSLSLGIDEPSISYWLCVERVPEEELKKQMKRRLSCGVVCFNQTELHNLFGLLLRASSAFKLKLCTRLKPYLHFFCNEQTFWRELQLTTVVN